MIGLYPVLSLSMVRILALWNSNTYLCTQFAPLSRLDSVTKSYNASKLTYLPLAGPFDYSVRSAKISEHVKQEINVLANPATDPISCFNDCHVKALFDEHGGTSETRYTSTNDPYVWTHGCLSLSLEIKISLVIPQLIEFRGMMAWMAMENLCTDLGSGTEHYYSGALAVFSFCVRNVGHNQYWRACPQA